MPELGRDLHVESTGWDVTPMLDYLAWRVGSKSYSQGSYEGLVPKMGFRLANLGPEKKSLGSPKVPELGGDLHVEAMGLDVTPMLDYLAWLVGSKS